MAATCQKRAFENGGCFALLFSVEKKKLQYKSYHMSFTKIFILFLEVQTVLKKNAYIVLSVVYTYELNWILDNICY